ncbi:MAG: hypothetical protein Q8O09_00910 [Bacillota bacterium]|nr:hypothetical protein [Bacillota bacterium]
MKLFKRVLFTLVAVLTAFSLSACFAVDVAKNLFSNAAKDADDANEHMLAELGEVMVALDELGDGAYDSINDDKDFANYLDEWPNYSDGTPMKLTISDGEPTVSK